MEGFLSGIHASPFQGPSVDFHDYREYQPGDDLRRIDWRLYARSDRLCVRRYEKETNARGYIVLDASRSMAYRGKGAWASKIEAARTIALALSLLLLRQRDAVGLLATGPTLRFVRPSQKPHQGALLLRELQATETQGGAQLGELLRNASRLLHKRSLVVLLSDLLEPSPEVERGLRELRFEGHDCLCLQILDGDEIDFPFEDTLTFEDLETGERREVAAAEARREYRERFAAFFEGYRLLFSDLEIPHQVIRTDEDPRGALRELFTRLG
jgi:uncharacterized protein (DUF58 family)